MALKLEMFLSAGIWVIRLLFRSGHLEVRNVLFTSRRPEFNSDAQCGMVDTSHSFG